MYIESAIITEKNLNEILLATHVEISYNNSYIDVVDNNMKIENAFTMMITINKGNTKFVFK